MIGMEDCVLMLMSAAAGNAWPDSWMVSFVKSALMFAGRYLRSASSSSEKAS